jgi:hypothetical protein
MEGFEVAQPPVARNDDVSAGSQRAGEHIIVVRICCRACNRSRDDTGNQRFVERQDRRRVPMMAFKPSRDIAASEYFGELGEKFV